MTATKTVNVPPLPTATDPVAHARVVPALVVTYHEAVDVLAATLKVLELPTMLGELVLSVRVRTTLVGGLVHPKGGTSYTFVRSPQIRTSSTAVAAAAPMS